MNFKFNKKQVLTLIALLGFLVLIPLTSSLVRQRQEIRKKAAGTGVIKVTLSPSGVSKSPGESLDINVVLTSTEAKAVMGAGVKMSFATDIFTISTPTCGTSFPTAQANAVANNIITLNCYIPGGSPAVNIQPGTPVILATFNATVKPQAPAGETSISFTFTGVADNDGNDLSDAGTSATYTISGAGVTGTPTPTPTATGTPGPTATATPRPTATPTTQPPGEVQIRLRVKFAGVNQQRANQNIRVKILKDGWLKQELPFSSVSVSSGTSGVYQSGFITLSSAVTAGSGYTFLVKGPKHLQTLFCTSSGQSRPCDPHLSRTLITLNNGENTLDFSTYPLPAGDLPHPVYGQDGVVNSIDATLLVNCFGDPQGQSCLNQADLNLDGIISSIDMELINQTIYTRWEDE